MGTSTPRTASRARVVSSISTFTTSIEAFQFVEKTPPAAVVVSLSLPEGAAIDLLRSFRGRPALASTPFIGLAVKTATEDIQRAQESGFAGVSRKPIDAADLEANPDLKHRLLAV